MEKKILLAVDDSVHSRLAVRYAARMSAVVPGIDFTLLHVQPAVPRFMVDEAKWDLKAQAALAKMAARNLESTNRLLEAHQEDLVRAGVPERAIVTKNLPRSRGAAKDILDHAQEGLFDAALVGRRGMSSIEEMLMGSVSSDLIQNSRLIPVWLVDGEVGSGDILAAVDGSENSLRAVDHLCFMLSGNPAARFCLLHITPMLRDYCAVDFSNTEEPELEEAAVQGDRRCMDDFFGAALKKLREAGIAESQMEIKTATTAIGVGREILKAAKGRGCGTIVMGRRGVNKSFFSGSVSHHVCQNLADAAVWLVP